jgi:hypothetical protein
VHASTMRGAKCFEMNLQAFLCYGHKMNHDEVRQALALLKKNGINLIRESAHVIASSGGPVARMQLETALDKCIEACPDTAKEVTEVRELSRQATEKQRQRRDEAMASRFGVDEPSSR